jgi:hypothetical protein
MPWGRRNATAPSHLPCGEHDNVKVHLTALSNRRDGAERSLSRLFKAPYDSPAEPAVRIA